MTGGWGTPVGRRTWLWLLVASALLVAPPAATAATPQYSLEFTSTINDQFLGLNNGPTGTITNEYQAVVPLTASATNPGLFKGSSEGKYAKTTGTASTALTCDNGTQQTNNEQIDKSGNPAPFSAAYDPSTQNLALGTGLPTETYEETTSNPACLTPFLPIDVPQPLWYAGFTAVHRGAVSLAGPNTFTFTMDPGSGNTVGALDFDDDYPSASNENLKLSELTTITVVRVGPSGPSPQCVVPRLKGDSLGVAGLALSHAGCALGTVSYKKSSKANKGRVLSSSPPAGAKEPARTKVNVTVGKL